jgi:hypothetical protein
VDPVLVPEDTMTAEQNEQDRKDQEEVLPGFAEVVSMKEIPITKKMRYFTHIVWWIIRDEITEQIRIWEILRCQDFFQLPEMGRRWKEEDTIKKNRRGFFLEYGRYP